MLTVLGLQGTAQNLVGTGVAIANTTLVVSGAGNFTGSGYNYAGKFNFVCSR